MNLYAYVANDPLNRGDPTGLEGYCGGTCYPMDRPAPPPEPPHGTGTTLIGVGGSATGAVPGRPIRGSIQGSAGVAFNSHEVRGFASLSGTATATTAAPVKIGESGVVGVLVGHHNGDPVDTGGPFSHVTGTAGAGVAVSVDHFGGSSAKGLLRYLERTPGAPGTWRVTLDFLLQEHLRGRGEACTLLASTSGGPTKWEQRQHRWILENFRSEGSAVRVAR